MISKLSNGSRSDNNLNFDLNEFGYHIFPSKLSQNDVERVIDDLSNRLARRTPLNDRDHSQWWDEIGFEGDSIAAKILYHKGIHQNILEFWPEPTKYAFWANVYRAGECIPKHRDTEGHLQLLTALIIPPKQNGGDLIIHHRDKARAISLEPGQQLLFRAHKTFHETRPLIATENFTNPIRGVGVCRIFLS